MATGVLAENVGRQDVLLYRGVTNRLAVRWERDSGAGYEPVDLSGYVCEFRMLDGSGEQFYERACDAHGTDGIAAVYAPPDAFTGSAWDSRESGTWRMTTTRGGVTELLGWGYWTLID